MLQNVNKKMMLLGLSVLLSVILYGGKVSIALDGWPPSVTVPETSLMWKLIMSGIGIYFVICSFHKSDTR